MQNEANFSIADCRLRIGADLRRDAPCGLPPSVPTGQLCKTKPISGSPAGTGGQNVRNKPNLEERTGRGRGRLCETKPNLGGLGHLEKRAVIVCGATLPESGTCETNPICRRRARKTIVKVKGLGDATLRGAIAPNKPNSAARSIVRQRLIARCRPGNKPSCPKRGTEAVSGSRWPAKYPPFHCSIVPPFQSGTFCAKQSQSPTVPGLDWSWSRLGAIMAACRWVWHKRH